MALDPHVGASFGGVRNWGTLWEEGGGSSGLEYLGVYDTLNLTHREPRAGASLFTFGLWGFSPRRGFTRSPSREAGG